MNTITDKEFTEMLKDGCNFKFKACNDHNWTDRPAIQRYDMTVRHTKKVKKVEYKKKWLFKVCHLQLIRFKRIQVQLKS